MLSSRTSNRFTCKTMLLVLPLWISLNIYAFILDMLTLAVGTAAWFLFVSGYPVFGIAAAAVSGAVLFVALRVHLSYPVKLQTYKVLLRRNQKKLHASSFYEFMDSPCYRMVVRVVLYRTGHPEVYFEIYKNIFGDGMPCFAPKLATVTFFDDASAGSRWLYEHNHRLQELEQNSASDSDEHNSN